MSGHSKWSKVKHKKVKEDAKRGKIFSKLIKEITVAARLGGGDLESNARLRLVVTKAKAVNMPADNIERAIKRGTGELEGVNYEDSTIEGYAPGGIAVMIDILTDNRKRAIADIRNIFTRGGGNLGESGCVSWIFEKRGLICFEQDKVDDAKLLEVATEAGALDIKEDSDDYNVITEPEDFEKIKSLFDEVDLKYSYAEITMLPKTTVRVEGREAERVLHLLEALEEQDDVQNVYSNFDIPDEKLLSK